MMNQVQVRFTDKNAGGGRDWCKFRLTGVYEDEAGYRCVDVYEAGELPGVYAGAFGKVVGVVVGLNGAWGAEVVWAELGAEVVDDEVREYVELRIEAVRDGNKGARRVFTRRDYPQLVFRDEDVVGMFKYFTGGNAEDEG